MFFYAWVCWAQETSHKLIKHSSKYSEILAAKCDTISQETQSEKSLQWTMNSKHTAKSTMTYFMKCKLKLLEWPFRMKIIENLCVGLKHAVHAR